MQISSSSSSSSSFLKSEPQFRYDVFINFWGADIGRKLVSHLHSVLLQAQVKTLIKEENLQEGMELEEHMRAIAATKIAIIVFSKSYTESTCCLFQLEKIIECFETFGQIILPIFYEVDPLNLSYQVDFGFGNACEELIDHKSYPLMFRWRRALNTAAGISGLDVRDFRHDAELVEKVVFRVFELLDYKDFSITQFPVGLEWHVEKVIGCIENHSTKVCMIGIWGMGGSGKTTLAKAIYNRIYPPFIGKSFMENIREVWDPAGHVDLQTMQLKVEVGSVGMGKTMLENGLSRKRVLIVLDDVNKFDQLEKLSWNRDWFGQGTVIIITTRDVHLLNRLKVDYVYKMDVMNENESLELFSWHAFRKAKPREDFNELARNMVAYCRGLPLALEVLGSFLCDKTMEEWESVLPKAKVIPIHQIQEKLRKSYDGLSNMEKDIFLDVCCFFVGKDRGYVTDILNGCELHADIGITVLIERGLIKVERNNKLEMHPLFRDMGREIIRQSWPNEPGKRSRLWFQDDVQHVLKKMTGTEATQGLSLKLHSTSTDCFKARAFKKMKRLRLLQLDHVKLTGDYGF
uniref:TIR domain-containing protein n=1 Tax=Phaseolus vulgaris TaxID=3885 RepID=V7AKU9_PHAVU|nr:hypothetical protein PHAVU_010G028500g [Phaseolus vulgaris]ESW06202.1 hypothetical protein PHAVU_010G028500g [Phaseolus vulgaris]